MGDLEAQSSPQSSKDTADDRLDEILSLYTAACNVQDEHGNTYYDFSYIEAKKAIASYLAEQEAALVKRLKSKATHYNDKEIAIPIWAFEAEQARLQKGQHGA